MRKARHAAGPAVPLLLLLVNGCSSDRPYAGPPGRPHRPQATASKPEAVVSAGPADPLIGDAGQASADPLMGHDPLLGQDSLEGPKMPTQHSHWLQGHLHGARVTVLLNGVRYGSFSGVLSHEDITMRLRQGTNTVTFVYQPGAASSAGSLEIVEGEHHPPLAPLVTFRSPSTPEAGNRDRNDDPLKPVTQTFPFIAN